DPGGWAWTDLPGGVPDADDTSGALLALSHLGETDSIKVLDAAENGIRWLLGLQNRDGGWPTFCRGWGALPFDRSAPDITAHVLRALRAADYAPLWESSEGRSPRVRRAIDRGFTYLARPQRSDGAWLPL